MLHRLVRHQPGNGQRQAGKHFFAIDGDKPAPHLADCPRCRQHTRVIGPDDDNVVMVVSDRGSQRAGLQAHATDKAQTDVACALVALDHGHLEHVLLGVGDRIAVVRAYHRFDQVLGDDLIFNHANDPRLGPVSVYLKSMRVHLIPVQVYGVTHVGVINLGIAPRSRSRSRFRIGRAVLGDQTAAAKDQLYLDVLQVSKDHQVGPFARRHRATVIQAEPFGSVERRHADSRHGVQAIGDGDAHHVVDVPIVEQVGRVTVVGAQAAAAAVLRRDGR